MVCGREAKGPGTREPTAVVASTVCKDHLKNTNYAPFQPACRGSIRHHVLSYLRRRCAANLVPKSGASAERFLSFSPALKMSKFEFEKPKKKNKNKNKNENTQLSRKQKNEIQNGIPKQEQNKQKIRSENHHSLTDKQQRISPCSLTCHGIGPSELSHKHKASSRPRTGQPNPP